MIDEKYVDDEKTDYVFLLTKGYRFIQQIVPRKHSASSSGWSFFSNRFRLVHKCKDPSCGEIFTKNEAARHHRQSVHSNRVFYDSQVVVENLTKDIERFEFNMIKYSKFLKYYRFEDEVEVLQTVCQAYQAQMCQVYRDRIQNDVYMDGLRLGHYAMFLGEDRLNPKMWKPNWFGILFPRKSNPYCYICSGDVIDGESPEILKDVVSQQVRDLLSCVTVYKNGVQLNRVVDYPCRGYRDDFTKYCLWAKKHKSDDLLALTMKDSSLPFFYHYTQQLNHPHVHYFNPTHFIDVKISHSKVVRMNGIQYSVTCIVFDTYKSILRSWTMESDDDAPLKWASDDIIHEVLLPIDRCYNEMGEYKYILLGLMALVFDFLVPSQIFVSKDIDFKTDQFDLWIHIHRVLYSLRDSPVNTYLERYIKEGTIPISTFVKRLHHTNKIPLSEYNFKYVLTRTGIKEATDMLVSEPIPYVKPIQANKDMIDAVVKIQQSGHIIWFAIREYDGEKIITFISPCRTYHVSFTVSHCILTTPNEFQAAVEASSGSAMLYPIDDLVSDKMYFIYMSSNCYIF